MVHSIGTRFEDRFSLTGVLGQGAMGAVYEVLDEHLHGVHWALKELDLGVVLEKEKPEAIALFKREVAIQAKVCHPGCPRVIHEFSSDSGAPAFVMGKVEGIALDRLIEEVGRPLSLYEVLPIMLQVCHILEHLHAAKPPIVFRDLKPSNLILTEHGLVCLIDFGIARYFDTAKKKDTQDLGTPGFCSPEQYGRGQTTARSDLYALGATAYFLLTRADLQNFAFNVPPLTALCQEPGADKLEEILVSLLQLLPKDRPSSAAALRRQLKRLFIELGPRKAQQTQRLHPGLRALGSHALYTNYRPKGLTFKFLGRWLRQIF